MWQGPFATVDAANALAPVPGTPPAAARRDRRASGVVGRWRPLDCSSSCPCRLPGSCSASRSCRGSCCAHCSSRWATQGQSVASMGALLALALTQGWMSEREARAHPPAGSTWRVARARVALIEAVEERVPRFEPIAADFMLGPLLLARLGHPVPLSPKWESAATRERVMRSWTTLYRGSLEERVEHQRRDLECRYLLLDERLLLHTPAARWMAGIPLDGEPAIPGTALEAPTGGGPRALRAALAPRGYPGRPLAPAPPGRRGLRDRNLLERESAGTTPTPGARSLAVLLKGERRARRGLDEALARGAAGRGSCRASAGLRGALIADRERAVLGREVARVALQRGWPGSRNGLRRPRGPSMRASFLHPALCFLLATACTAPAGQARSRPLIRARRRASRRSSRARRSSPPFPTAIDAARAGVWVELPASRARGDPRGVSLRGGPRLGPRLEPRGPGPGTARRGRWCCNCGGSGGRSTSRGPEPRLPEPRGRRPRQRPWGVLRPGSAAHRLPVAAEEDGRILVELTSFLARDAHGSIATLKRSGQGGFRLDDEASTVLPAQCHAFPDNLELEARLVLRSDAPGGEVRSTAATPEAVVLVQHHSLLRLPEAGYEPLAFDPRGELPVSYADYSSPLGEPLQQHLATRHRLEVGEDGRVVEPIVYHLDPATPEPIRSALLDGARWWAEAFEAAGLRGAYRVEVLPEGVHPRRALQRDRVGPPPDPRLVLRQLDRGSAHGRDREGARPARVPARAAGHHALRGHPRRRGHGFRRSRGSPSSWPWRACASWLRTRSATPWASPTTSLPPARGVPP